MNPFDFLKSINSTKEDLIGSSELQEKDYNSFLVNKALSYHADTIFHANMMNVNALLDKKMQYDYLRHSVSKKSRFSKWAKTEMNENAEILMKYYGYSYNKALDALKCLSKEQIQEIKLKFNEGGPTSSKK